MAKKTPNKKSNGAPNGKNGTLPTTKKMATRLDLNVGRLENIHKRIVKWKSEHDIGKAKELLDSGIKQIEEASKILTNVPDDFIPWKIGVPQAKSFTIDDMVRITDKRQSEYEDMLEIDEMKDLKVIEERGKSVMVETAEGMKMLLRRAHLMAQETA